MRQEPFERPSRLDGPHHAAARYPANIVRKRAQKAVRPVNMLCPAKPRHSFVGEARRSRAKQLSEASQPRFASSGNTKIKRPTRPHAHQYPLFAQISAFLVRPDGWLAPILSNSFFVACAKPIERFRSSRGCCWKRPIYSCIHDLWNAKNGSTANIPSHLALNASSVFRKLSRGGSVCLNSFWSVRRWLPALVKPRAG
jgi:hypothetical protein